MFGASVAEEGIYKLIIENISSLDVDIKVRIRKGTHLVKNFSKSDSKGNILQKIESKEQYGQNMLLRHQDEKEIKVELMLKQFMEALDEKIDNVNRGGILAI
jgi:hypothetical protein